MNKAASTQSLQITNYVTNQFLSCTICTQPYNQTDRAPIQACQNCMDVVCLKCLNSMEKSAKQKKILNKCNMCRQAILPLKFKKCFPLVRALSLPQKIKNMELKYQENENSSTIPNVSKKQQAKKTAELNRKIKKGQKDLESAYRVINNMKDAKKVQDQKLKKALEQLQLTKIKLRNSSDQNQTMSLYYNAQMRIQHQQISQKDRQIARLNFRVRSYQLSINHSL